MSYDIKIAKHYGYRKSPRKDNTYYRRIDYWDIRTNTIYHLHISNEGNRLYKISLSWNRKLIKKSYVDNMFKANRTLEEWGLTI